MDLLRENVSGNDELQIVDPAEEALVRKLLDDTEKMDVEVEEKRDELEEKREEEVAKGADNEKGEEVGFQTVEKKKRRKKEMGVREKGTEEERVEVEEMGAGEKGMEKEAVGMGMENFLIKELYQIKLNLIAQKKELHNCVKDDPELSKTASRKLQASVTKQKAEKNHFFLPGKKN